MNNNIDVVKQLEEKNKEIYYNKLNMDIENNSETLSITLNNIISVLMNELTSKLLEFDNKNSNDDVIQKLVVAFQEKLNEQIEVLIQNRLVKLKEIVNEISDIDYKEILENEKERIVSSLSSYFKDNAIKIKNIGNNYDSFNKERLNDYIDVLFYEKLINKVKESISNMDNILYNNYQANLEKFNNLNAKTLNLV